MWFDNNCSLYKMIKNDDKDKQYFEHVYFPVDVFHFKSKHKESDTFCGEHCNPVLFPELYDADTKQWRFNSSAAEQVNAWFDGYGKIVREMMQDRYEFFLDEMIKRRNRWLFNELRKREKNPRFIAREDLLRD